MKTTFRQGYLLIVFCLLAVSFLYVRFAVLPKQNNQTQIEQQRYQEVVEQVERETGIDKNDVPALSFVDDLPTLKAANPEFYQNAKVGDWVLRYSNKVVLYRLDSKTIIAEQIFQSAP